MDTRTLTTSKGDSVVSTLSDNEAFTRLIRLKDESSFAASLLESGTRRGLTHNQWVWVHKLAMETQRKRKV